MVVKMKWVIPLICTLVCTDMIQETEECRFYHKELNNEQHSLDRR